jgi:hypothetical protein
MYPSIRKLALKEIDKIRRRRCGSVQAIVESVKAVWLYIPVWTVLDPAWSIEAKYLCVIDRFVHTLLSARQRKQRYS